jgi:hypothetical protein
MTVPVAFVSNCVRIASIILVAHVWDVRVATGWYHDASGLLIFVLAFVLMFGLEELVLRVRRLIGRPAVVLPMYHDVRRGPQDKGQGMRMILSVGGRAGWLAGIMIDLVVDGRQPATEELVLDDNVLTGLRTRDYVYRRYLPPHPGGAPTDICIVYSQTTPESIHPPELCLEGGGQTILMGQNIVLGGVGVHGEMPCRELVVRFGADERYFLFTYKCGSEYSDDFGRHWFRYLTANRLGRTAGVALVRVSTPVGSDLDAARKRAAALLRAAVPHLDSRLP